MACGLEAAPARRIPLRTASDARGGIHHSLRERNRSKTACGFLSGPVEAYPTRHDGEFAHAIRLRTEAQMVKRQRRPSAGRESKSIR